MDTSENSLTVGGGENAFPDDYSVSGWFRSLPTAAAQYYYLHFRLTENEKGIN